MALSQVGPRLQSRSMNLSGMQPGIIFLHIHGTLLQPVGFCCVEEHEADDTTTTTITTTTATATTTTTTTTTTNNKNKNS